MATTKIKGIVRNGVLYAVHAKAIWPDQIGSPQRQDTVGEPSPSQAEEEMAKHL